MIGILGYTYFNYINETEAIDSNITTYKIIDESNSILISLLNMETGARGFALSGKDEFLDPFEQGEAEFNLHFSAIKELTKNNESQQARLTELEELYHKWYEWETQKIIEGRRQVNEGLLHMDDIVALARTDMGKNQMDSIRSLLNGIISEERKTLSQRYTILNAANEKTGLVISIGGIIAVLCSLLISLFISHAISNPIKKLVKSVENITQQTYQESVAFSTDKEFGILIQRFSDMQLAIQSREAELNKKNETLKLQMLEVNEANRLKSQFLANMSHELRTPLNSIIGFTNRVIKKSGDLLPAVQQENLVIVLDEARHLLELINSLLDYSKIESGKMEVHPEKFNLVDVINEVFTMTKTLAEGKDIQYIQDTYDLEQIPIQSDRLKIKQILINLLSNAFKYSDRGTITLSVQKKERSYSIQVSDEGIGISEQDLIHIFEEFRQVDGSYARKVGGTGLGLSITKKFIELLGGRIKVTSEIGIGSCFQVELPIDLGEPEEQADIENGEIQPAKKKVLCIDDDFNVQRLYKQYLNEYHIEVVALYGEESIVEKVIEINPDLILLDIMLPKKDGWEILSELKNNTHTKHIPIVMNSVLSEKNLAYQMKADDYLIKPVSQEELIELINRNLSNKNERDILVADDDENFLKLVGQYLKEENIPFRLACNGEDALKQARYKKPDLLILDIMMPKKDGFMVIEELQQSQGLKDIPIVVVTAKDLTNSEKAELQKRANAVIQKSTIMLDSMMQTLIEKLKESL
jgi:signal transduction histidine kinase/CheY-like chemotaxis protein